jgi:hypothetical protein
MHACLTACACARARASDLVSQVVKPARAFSAVFLYTLIGTLIFVYGQDMSVVDAVYFMIVTMATVGCVGCHATPTRTCAFAKLRTLQHVAPACAHRYGDVAPTKPLLKAFSVLWIFVAIIFVFPEVTGLVGACARPCVCVQPMSARATVVDMCD